MKEKVTLAILTGALSLLLMVGFSGVLFAQQQPQTYVALGDSIAAGAGLSSASGEDGLCDRSERAYPEIVARSVGLSLQNYACSGAKADEGVYDEQELGSTDIPAQLDRAFDGAAPELMTITIGANDARWGQFIRQCYFYRCGYGVDTARSAVYLADLRLELNVVMAQIHHMSNGNPPIVLVNGYYNPFVGQECTNVDGFTAEESAWLDGRIDELNEAIRETAERYSYAHFVPINFSGHGLCSSESWVQDLNDNAPFHPNANGQVAIARANIAEYEQVAGSRTVQPSSWRERLLNWFELNGN